MTPIEMLYTIAALVAAFIWAAVPFAVFGVKSLLTRLIKEQRATNALLAKLTSSYVNKNGDYS